MNIISTSREDQLKDPMNKLANEKSPYLLQHKHNPVNWFPWGDEAFQQAQKQNKLIFLSIGYATCHWCHVMEKDSFERQDVAEVLNKHYISIKVDREERPDVDQIYMSALQAIAGGGGWPLSMFLTPQGLPFFGQTFIPRENFKRLLTDMAEIWTKEPQRIEQGGVEVREFLKENAAKAQNDEAHAGHKSIINESALINFFRDSERSFDQVWGGLKGAPKFPHSTHLSTLLRVYRRTGNRTALELVTKSLDAMARGGIYDQLGGGFHRYSTDSKWLVPHFEKMLYDNALLAITYLEAFQVTKNPEYERVVRGTLGYVLRDMTDSRGAFYSAEDADSELAEGKFYVWHEDELKEALTAEEFQRVREVYGVTAQGNFNPDQRVRDLEEAAGLKSVHGANIFFVKIDQPLPSKEDLLLNSARKKLFEIRERRVHPLKDDKILTSWNGLMIAAIAFAAQVLDDQTYLNAAQRAADFVLKNLRGSQGQLMARFRDGEARFNAYLDDHAFLIWGLLNLYEADFDPRWFEEALALQRKQDKLFYDENEGGYFFTDGSDSTVFIRRKETYDGALPSGNSISALNLLRLGAFQGDLEMREKALQIPLLSEAYLIKAPGAVAQLLQAIDFATDRAHEVVLIGSRKDREIEKTLRELKTRFLPNKVVVWADSGSQRGPAALQGRTLFEGKASFYICENGACGLPTNEVEKALELAEKYNRYEV